jgi:hypothetical protein
MTHQYPCRTDGAALKWFVNEHGNVVSFCKGLLFQSLIMQRINNGSSIEVMTYISLLLLVGLITSKVGEIL